jgi:hypothetical protein
MTRYRAYEAQLAGHTIGETSTGPPPSSSRLPDPAEVIPGGLASVCWLAPFGFRASPDAITQARYDTEAMAVRAQTLVADDDHRLRAFARAMLERDGFTVAEAATSAAPAEAARAVRPRLVLLDIQPPDSDGFEGPDGWQARRRTGDRADVNPEGKRLRRPDRRVGSIPTRSPSCVIPKETR